MGLLKRLRSLLKLGIRHRLIALMALAAMALALDSYVDVMARHDQRVEEVKTRMLLVARNSADNQYEFSSAARLLLGIVTKLAPSLDACGEDFLELASGSKWLKAISITDPQGDVLCSSSPLLQKINLADRTYFKEVLRTRGFVMSDYIKGRVLGQPMVVAAAPRMDYDNQVDSVIILSIDLSWLNQLAENIGGGENTSVILLDSSATVVSADESAKGMIGKALGRDPFFKQLVANDQAVLASDRQDGIARLYASAKLVGTGARLIIGFPEDELLAPVRAEAKAELLKNSLFFLVLFAIAWMLADQVIIRPIRALTEAAAAFGAGDRRVRVDAESLPDDFTGLAETFNATADLLARNQELIVEKNRRLGDANARLGDLACHDELTGLANRRVLNDRLKEIFEPEATGSIALLVLDLDKFKPVNDVLGHPCGDVVLKEVAQRLLEIAEKGDLVARLGGDEFALVLDCTSNESGRALQVANKIIRAISAPFFLKSSHVEIGATIGIALSGTDAKEPDELLRAADLAMYRAKRDQRGGFCFFDKSMQADLQARVMLEADLRAGIKAGEIIPFYQPLVELATGRIVGLEVLARWRHPSKGILPPSMFIQVAAEVGLMESLTRHLVGSACRDARHWPEHITLSINLSPTQLSNPLLPTLVASIAMDCGVAPGRIEIEITEDALIRDFANAQLVMQAFRNLGMKLALDDFGTGYSSLQNLHELRFDKLKIDRSFITDLLANKDSHKLVSAIVGLARNLNLPVTAEGIEDLEVIDLLSEMGCTYGQGYALGRPMPAGDVSALLLDKSNPIRSRVA